MKKILYASAALLFLAAGCAGQAPSSDQARNQAPPKLTNEGVEKLEANLPKPANVEINSVDDAAALIEQGSQGQESALTAGDDSDLTGGDAEQLNGFTEVPNVQ